MRRLMIFVYFLIKKIVGKAFLALTYYEYKGLTHHVQQVVELLLDKTDIHHVAVGNYYFRNVVRNIMTMSGTPSYLARI